jgi:DNA-binding SARP family transcriptional activator/Flp pilus assembly protein TadD
LLRLRALGGLSIEQVGGTPLAPSVSSARRRLAIVAVLAASEPAAVSRDKLVALFWPESDAERARHALDQALYSLRRSLDVENLFVGREELSLDRAVITSDVRELRDAFARGDFAAAVELYAGPFLDGVYISGSQEFDHWVDAARDRIAHDIARALESLARESASLGDHAGAARRWRRLLAEDPRNERVVLAVMTALAASGDPAGALRQADVYHAILKADGDDASSAAVAQLMEKISRAPAPAITPPPSESRVEEVPRLAASPPPSARPSQPIRLRPKEDHHPPLPPTPARRSRSWYRGAGTAAVIIAVSLSTAWVIAERYRTPERGLILAADFENHTADSVFDRSLDAALRAGLEQSPNVTLLPRARVQQTLRRMQRPSMNSGSVAQSGTAMGRVPLVDSVAREVALREGIHTFLVPAIDRVDSAYVLSARLVDTRTGNELWAETSRAARRPVVLDALDTLIRRLRRRIGESSATIAKHDRGLPQVTTSSLEALQKFAESLDENETGHIGASMELLKEAVAIDSNFALAHANLGAAYYLHNDRPNGDIQFDRALALANRLSDREQLGVRASAESWRGNREHAVDMRLAMVREYPDDPETWALLGYDYLQLHRKNEAIAAFEKAIARDSNVAPVLINLATTLKGTPRNADAIRFYRRAFGLQPDMQRSQNINMEYIGALVFAGRFEEAAPALDAMRHGATTAQALADRTEALLSMFQGRYSRAVELFRNAVVGTQVRGSELSEARNRMFLASAEEQKGWRDSAAAELGRAYDLSRKVYFEPGFLMYLGKALVRDGQLARAEEVLDSLRRRAKPQNRVDQANLALLVGEVALARGLADSAVRALRLSVAADSTPYTVESLARALAARGDLASAARAYESIAAKPADGFGFEAEQFSLTAWRDAGAVYEKLGDTVRARAAYEHQIELWPRGDGDLAALRDARAGLARLKTRSR